MYYINFIASRNKKLQYLFLITGLIIAISTILSKLIEQLTGLVRTLQNTGQRGMISSVLMKGLKTTKGIVNSLTKGAGIFKTLFGGDKDKGSFSLGSILGGNLFGGDKDKGSSSLGSILGGNLFGGDKDKGSFSLGSILGGNLFGGDKDKGSTSLGSMLDGSNFLTGLLKP